MNTKGFADNNANIETPYDVGVSEKPLISDENLNKRVDINVLKARAKAMEDKQNTKNTLIVIFFLIAFGSIGIYFST